MTMAMALVWTDFLGLGLKLAFIALVLWLMLRRRWLAATIVVGMMVALVIAANVWRSGHHLKKANGALPAAELYRATHRTA